MQKTKKHMRFLMISYDFLNPHHPMLRKLEVWKTHEAEAQVAEAQLADCR